MQILSQTASLGLRLFVNLAICGEYINGLVQDCSNPSVLAMELLQSCTKPWHRKHSKDVYVL